MFDVEKIGSAVEKTATDLHQEFVEMGQIKTDFDIEKFTTLKEGNFIASSYHFLMRQHRLYIDQLRTWLIEYERNRRDIALLKAEQEYRKNRMSYQSDIALLKAEQEYRKNRMSYQSSSEETKKDLAKREHLDLDILELETRQHGLEIDISGRMQVIKHFEKNRQALIEKNGGTAPTNEQYQEEQPAYYKWFLAKKALQEIQERQTGIKEGTIEAVLMACREPLLKDSKMQSKPFLVCENGTLVLEELLKSAFIKTDGLISVGEAEKLHTQIASTSNQYDLDNRIQLS